MKLFETHCHLDFDNYKIDRKQLIKFCINSGVKCFINIGIDEQTSRNSIALAQEYPMFYASVGYHPHDADKFNLRTLIQLIKEPKVVAIGEIGLDYYRKKHAPLVQKKAFDEQLALGSQKKMPLIIHNREADTDVLLMLKRHSPPKVVFHCFSGDLAMAEEIWSNGWYISITATITYPNSTLTEVVKNAPADKLMIETDSPFLSPQHIRGKRNDPSSLRYVIETIANIRKEPIETLSEQIFNNSCKFFLEKT